MRRMIMSSALALVLCCGIGVSVASADLVLNLLIENKTTRETGTQISAAPGDLVKFSLDLRNGGGKIDVDVTVVGGIPGCMIEETVTTSLSAKQKRRQNVSGKVPSGHAGRTLTVEVQAVASDGRTATAQGSVNLVASKATSGSNQPSPFARTFLRLLARGLLQSMQDDGPASTTLSGIKMLFR